MLPKVSGIANAKEAALMTWGFPYFMFHIKPWIFWGALVVIAILAYRWLGKKNPTEPEQRVS